MFMRTADVTCRMKWPEGTADPESKMVSVTATASETASHLDYRLCLVTTLNWTSPFITTLQQRLVLGKFRLFESCHVRDADNETSFTLREGGRTGKLLSYKQG